MLWSVAWQVPSPTGPSRNRRHHFVAPALVVRNSRPLSLHHFVAQSVLYGIFPVVLGVMGLSAVRLRIIKRPLVELRAAHLNPASMGRLRDVYRFSSVDQVRPGASCVCNSRAW